MAILAIFILLFGSVTVFLILKRLFVKPTIRSLDNRHVMITGGSSGIGRAAAVMCSQLGAHVTIIARNIEKLEAAKEEIMKAAKDPHSQKFSCISLDVTQNLEVITKAVSDSEKEIGPVFMLINCAGMAVCGTLEDSTENNFKYMMDLNYFGTVFPIKAVVCGMKQRNEGHIVITGSQASLLGIYGMGAYCASKFALRGLAETLHMELNPHNVKVTLCLPPDTNTPGLLNEDKSKPEITKLISETAGLAEPEEVAHMLISDAMNGRFLSTIGFEGFILTTLCAGMGPLSSVGEVFLQVTLMSLLRLVSVGYLVNFQTIIRKNIKPSDKKGN